MKTGGFDLIGQTFEVVTEDDDLAAGLGTLLTPMSSLGKSSPLFDILQTENLLESINFNTT
jgi:hypothetical protein